METLLYPITKGSKFSPSYATEYQRKTSKVVMTEGESYTTASKSPSGNDTCYFSYGPLSRISNMVLS